MKLWLNNTIEDRLYMLQKAAKDHPGINQLAIEKDWWVMVTLKALFRTTCADSLIFKGGTSLSKGFQIIERFSEDIDLAISHSFFGIDKTSKSQREKLRKMARVFVHDTLSSELDARLQELGVSGYRVENVTHQLDKDGNLKAIDSDKDPTVILLHYDSVVEGSVDYIPPRVKIEISCLSMDEPTEVREIQSYIADSFKEEDETLASIRTVLPSRTFLEKIFLLAEEFQKDKPRSVRMPRHVRMSRHLYDLERLMDSEYGRKALADRGLYDAIVEHRRTYYALKYVDYDKHDPRAISFVPPASVQELWAADYADMKRYFIYGDSLSFEQLIERVEELQERVRGTVTNL